MFNGVFFSTKKNLHFISKNAFSCLFLKNISPSKRVICFIYNYMGAFSLSFQIIFPLFFFGHYLNNLFILRRRYCWVYFILIFTARNSNRTYGSKWHFMQFWILWCFLFYQKNVHFISKNAFSCLFLKNVSPSKSVVCFILNNLHFPIVEGIAFYALHKSRVLIIPSADFWQKLWA